MTAYYDIGRQACKQSMKDLLEVKAVVDKSVTAQRGENLTGPGADALAKVLNEKGVKTVWKKLTKSVVDTLKEEAKDKDDTTQKSDVAYAKKVLQNGFASEIEKYYKEVGKAQKAAKSGKDVDVGALRSRAVSMREAVQKQQGIIAVAKNLPEGSIFRNNSHFTLETTLQQIDAQIKKEYRALKELAGV